jgi:hypothetical protein
MSLYLIANATMQTTAAPAAVTTGTSIKTLLQVKPFNLARIVEWGISFDGSAAATPIKVELIETDVAATVTASADADITKFGPNVADVAAASVAGLTLGTAATGYTATIEGTVAAVRNFDVQFVAPTNQYVKQFPLGREPVIQLAKFARVRVTAGAAVNAYCYLVLDL